MVEADVGGLVCPVVHVGWVPFVVVCLDGFLLDVVKFVCSVEVPGVPLQGLLLFPREDSQEQDASVVAVYRFVWMVVKRLRVRFVVGG